MRIPKGRGVSVDAKYYYLEFPYLKVKQAFGKEGRKVCWQLRALADQVGAVLSRIPHVYRHPLLKQQVRSAY